MIQTHEIRYFLALARELNFTKAAEACSVSQPSMTRAIRNLEHKVGGLLFDRRAGALVLTELGRSLLPRLQEGYAQIEAARTEAARLIATRRNQLRLGVMCTAGPGAISGLLQRFLASGQDDIELTVREARAGTVVELLLADEVDLAIAAWPSYPEEVEVLPLYTERYGILFHDKHIFAQLSDISLDNLTGEQYLERLSCEFDNHFEAQVGEWTIDIATRFASEREDWIQALARAGLGVAVVPEFMEIGGGLVIRPIGNPSIARTVALLMVRGRRRSQAAEEFVRIARTFDWQAALLHPSQ